MGNITSCLGDLSTATIFGVPWNVPGNPHALPPTIMLTTKTAVGDPLRAIISPKGGTGDLIESERSKV